MEKNSWEVYKKLPASLQEAIFSPDTADAIWHICQLCDINEVAKVAKRVGDVLIGSLPPEDLQQTLKKELGLDDNVAKKLDTYIQHYIFNPVADDLRELYHPEEKEIEEKEAEEKPKVKDVYREPIE